MSNTFPCRTCKVPFEPSEYKRARHDYQCPGCESKRKRLARKKRRESGLPATNKWTAEEDAVIIAGFEAGDSDREIAKRIVGRNVIAVCSRRNRLGLRRRAENPAFVPPVPVQRRRRLMAIVGDEVLDPANVAPERLTGVRFGVFEIKGTRRISV